jgi:hypothetical protein
MRRSGMKPYFTGSRAVRKRYLKRYKDNGDHNESKLISVAAERVDLHNPESERMEDH